MSRLFAYGAFLELLPHAAKPHAAADGAPAEEVQRASRTERARLKGHRGAFAARSTARWGTTANPAPLLALVPGGASRGIVLELEPREFEETLSRWSELEGADQVLQAEAEVGMPFRRDPATVTFLTADPQGPYALKQQPVERLARMVLVARGREGTGVEYLSRLMRQLREWGLEEPAAEALWKLVQKERGEAWR